MRDQRGTPRNATVKSRTAPSLSSGSLPLPHFGDCTQDGQPSSHSQAAMASRVAVSHSTAARVAPLGEARAAGMPVVDEDRRRAGVLVHRGGDAADVPAVAGREQREQADRGVLGRVRGARYVGPLQPGLGQHLRRDRPPDRPGAQVARRQVQRLLAEHLAGDHALAQERHDLVGHLDGAEGQLDRSPRRARLGLEDPDVGDVAGEGRVVGRRPAPAAPRARRGRASARGRSRPGAGRPRPRARCRAPPRRRPCPAAARSPPRPGAPARPPVPRMSARSLARSRPVQNQPGRPAAQQPAGHQVLGHLGRGRPEQRQVVVGERQLGGRRAQVRGEHVRVVGVEHGRLDRPAEQRLGVVHEVGVERVVARDEHRQRALRRRGRPGRPAATATPACPGSRRAGRRPARRCRRRARARWWRRRRAARPTAAPARGRGAPRAGSRRGRPRPGRPGRARPRRAAAGRWPRPTSAPRRDRTNATRPDPVDDQVGEQVAGLGGRRPPYRRSAAPRPARSAGGSHSANDRLAARRGVVVDRLDRHAGQPARGLGRVGDGRRGEHERRVAP